MRICKKQSLSDFEFWSGAIKRAKYLNDRDFEIIEQVFEELYPDGMTETQINDIFWFEEDFIAEILGYESFEVLQEDRDDE